MGCSRKAIADDEDNLDNAIKKVGLEGDKKWGSVALYSVEAVVDDRPSVCRMWRELGLKVIQVADPHLEF